MEISAAALPIYLRVLDLTVPEARDRAEELFSLAAAKDGDEVLSEEEAEEVEQALDYYDQQQRSSLGIGTHDEEEVSKVLEEYQALEKCWEKPGNPEAFAAFIQDYPQSKNLAEAYYRLGFAYVISHQPDKAIEAFEQVVADYPETIHASSALQQLVPLYTEVGRTKESMISAEQWLKRPVYQPHGYNMASTPSYGAVKVAMLFHLAEGYRSEEDLRQAQMYYWRVIKEGKRKDAEEESYYVKEAKGALYFIGAAPQFKTQLLHYLDSRTRNMFEQAEYLLYEKQDLLGAEKVCREVLTFHETLKGIEKTDDLSFRPFAAGRIRDKLEEIKLRRITSAVETLSVVAEMEKEGRVWPFFENQNLPPSLLDGIPAGIYLRFLLLNACKETEEVRIAKFSGVRIVDGETKTPQEYYAVIFRSQNIWRVVMDSTSSKRPGVEVEGGSFEEASKTIEQKTGMKFASLTTQKSLFAGSLRELNDPTRLSALMLVIDLEKQMLSEWGKEALDKFTLKLKGVEGAEEKRASFGRLLLILPAYHFKGLEKVNFGWASDGPAAQYSPGKIDIANGLNSSALESMLVHELGHHWDRFLARAPGGNYAVEAGGDLSLTFYKINWERWDDIYCGALLTEFCSGNPGDTCTLVFQPCGNWQRKLPVDLADFAWNYSLADGKEDFATSRESYVEGAYKINRVEVRKQMEEGNFEPAAQYLFNKYIVSFDPADGLCFEYNLKAGDPPLSLAEVKMKLRLWLEEHPGSVSLATLEAIQKIEQVYEEYKLTPPSEWDRA